MWYPSVQFASAYSSSQICLKRALSIFAVAYRSGFSDSACLVVLPIQDFLISLTTCSVVLESLPLFCLLCTILISLVYRIFILASWLSHIILSYCLPPSAVLFEANRYTTMLPFSFLSYCSCRPLMPTYLVLSIVTMAFGSSNSVIRIFTGQFHKVNYSLS